MDNVSREEFDALVSVVNTLSASIRCLEKEFAELPRVRTMTMEQLFTGDTPAHLLPMGRLADKPK